MKDLTNENVIHVKKGDIEFLQFKRLLEYSDIINHAYSLGIDKNFRLGNKEHTVTEEQKNIAINNYKKLANAIGSDYTHLVKGNQTHTNTVKFIEEKENKEQPDFFLAKLKNTDGLITNKPNIMLATINADCILLLLFDPIKKVIANVHSGWRGTLQKICIEAVLKMQKKYGSNPKDIICCMCPSIHKCHFEVEQDVKEKFEKEFKNLKGYICETIPNKKWNIDTVLINKEILKRAGLKEENIIDSGICSVCNSEIIHSYRAHGKACGLATSIIEIKG